MNIDKIQEQESLRSITKSILKLKNEMDKIISILNPIEINDYRYSGKYCTHILIEIFRPVHHQDFIFLCEFTVEQFELFCKSDNEINKDGFYEWWSNISILYKEKMILDFVQSVRIYGSTIEQKMDEKYELWLEEKKLKHEERTK